MKNAKKSVAEFEGATGKIIKHCEELYTKFEVIYEKLGSLAVLYGSDMDAQESLVEKFTENTAQMIGETQVDIENHIEEKLSRYKLLESSIVEYERDNKEYVKNFKAEAQVMIDKIGDWMEEVGDYEERVEKKAEALKAKAEQTQVQESAFLCKLADTYDVHRIEADLLRGSFRQTKIKKEEERAENVKELKDIIEHAANTAKFLRGESLEGLNMQLSLANGANNLLTHSIKQRAIRTREFYKKYMNTSKSIVENCEKVADEASLAVDTAYDVDMTLVSDGKKQMEAHCNEVSEWSKDSRDNLAQQSGRVGEYWESTYLQDHPSGMTPKKKSFEYPRNLSATSPHEAILERFSSKRRDAEKNEIF
jgi:hypothetical protein